MPDGRRALLDAMKKRGELPVEALAEAVGVTISGARQHLSGLERDGLVAHRILRGGAGRPRYVYYLTPAADALYPRTYAELTNELLEYVQDDDPELLKRTFERRAQRRLARARARLDGKPFADKVAELTRILDEDGYLADFERCDDGSFRIVEHNCAVLGVALRYGQACSSEIDFIRQALPEAKIERVAHIVAGAYVCAYSVEPRAG